MTYVKNKAFTLIELLVAISIIGLLSSIVLVSLKGTREKAKIAKSLEFSHSIQHSLGSEAVGIWNFDDCPGGTVNDSSGYGNNGTISGASCSSDTPHSIVGTGTGKYALSFDGAGDYVSVLDSNSLDITDAITIEVWVYINSLGSTNWGFLSKGSNTTGWGMWYYSPSGVFPIDFADNLGNRHYVDMPAGSIPVGAWAHVVGVYDRTYIRGYVNGVQKASRNVGAYTIATNANNLLIGQRTGSFFNGLIDEVRIYNQALTQAEIQQHYVEGLERYGDLALSD